MCASLSSFCRQSAPKRLHSAKVNATQQLRFAPKKATIRPYDAYGADLLTHVERRLLGSPPKTILAIFCNSCSAAWQACAACLTKKCTICDLAVPCSPPDEHFHNLQFFTVCDLAASCKPPDYIFHDQRPGRHLQSAWHQSCSQTMHLIATQPCRAPPASGCTLPPETCPSTLSWPSFSF